jgi:hypothetical protein
MSKRKTDSSTSSINTSSSNSKRRKNDSKQVIPYLDIYTYVVITLGISSESSQFIKDHLPTQLISLFLYVLQYSTLNEFLKHTKNVKQCYLSEQTSALKEKRSVNNVVPEDEWIITYYCLDHFIADKLIFTPLLDVPHPTYDLFVRPISGKAQGISKVQSFFANMFAKIDTVPDPLGTINKLLVNFAYNISNEIVHICAHGAKYHQFPIYSPNFESNHE